jgi:hypothetical protein
MGIIIIIFLVGIILEVKYKPRIFINEFDSVILFYNLSGTYRDNIVQRDYIVLIK